MIEQGKDAITLAWSTRELADLAGTTVNTVRHYHRAGLLEEPERLPNGYKQYRGRHLGRLLHIRRLRDLGVRLEQIASFGGDAAPALLSIDADLSTSIDRIQRAREEIRTLLEDTTTTDAPDGVGDVAHRRSLAGDE